MTNADHFKGIRISNFRSVLEPFELPLKSKLTFLVGQNNSGKTGILRFLGLLLNDGELTPEDVSSLTTKPSKVEYVFSSDVIREYAKGLRNMSQVLRGNAADQLTIERELGTKSALKFGAEIHSIIAPNYFESNGGFLSDFGSSSGREANLNVFLSRLWPQLNIPKTVYVPSLRIILQNAQTLYQFGQVPFPGTQIELNSIVQELATLDRPFGNPSQKQASQEKLRDICSFIAFCLEVQGVEIKIPEGKQTIYVSIDGNEQPISNLGSGIEQLIIVGMGSFKFPDHLVLIDEPELHFHPRTQKRMMKYLYDNAKARFVIATHSAAVLDSVEADIVQVWQKDHQCFGRTVHSSSDRYEAVRNLGHSPSELVLANFVVWVEGPSDRIYINHWIQKCDPSLVEGTDYAIIFYGGSVLARHGFEDSDGDEDLVKALSVSRNFAVYMDSDKSSEADNLKPRVERVSKEVAANGGLCWISDCREIENYIPESVKAQLKNFKFNPTNKWDRVVKTESFDKVKLAEFACAHWNDEWPLDLKAKCEELVTRINAAR